MIKHRRSYLVRLTLAATFMLPALSANSQRIMLSSDRRPEVPEEYLVEKGDTLWAIAQERYGSGFLYVRVFEANQDAIRDPDLIYPGQVFMIPEGDRNWPAPRSTGG